MLRKIKNNNVASAIPLLLFAVTIFSCGALYTFLFLEVGFPEFDSWIPAGDAKTFIMMMIYAIPLTVLIVGVIALLQAGLKKEVYY